MWLYASAVAFVLIATAAWFGGFVGPSTVLSPPEARKRLRAVGRSVVTARGAAPGRAMPRPSDNAPVSGTHHAAVEPAGDPKVNSESSLLDAAVPGGLAFAAGAIDWLTPDRAAVDAVSHLTGEEISNALDLHVTLASEQYQLLTEGSLLQWRGHVGEAQIAEQVESWAGAGAVVMPEAANFAGADLSIFGHDFQSKFVADYNDINNIHGDALIVAEDTANVPADALHIDLSEPFDPSILDGDDVIVAEGLTLAGAEDAWESAAGLAAGGLDGADAADLAEVAVIPGLGAAVRVAASGYRRRAALADADLRKRAMGRVARDAGYGVVGAGGGMAIGSAIGGLVDVATLGMTLGTGTWAGGAIGAAWGGKKAAALARAEDDVQVRVKREAVNAAILAYGTAVEAAQEEAGNAWSKAVAAAEQRADELGIVRRRELDVVNRLAHAELETLQQIRADEARTMLEQSAAIVEQSRAKARSPRARRRISSWIRASRQFTARLERTGCPDVEEVLLLVVAAPGGDRMVHGFLEERLKRRAVVLASTEHLVAAVHRTALHDRSMLAKELASRREAIRDLVRDDLEEPIEAVKVRTDHLKKELTVNGQI